MAEEERAAWSKYVTHMVNIYNSSDHSLTGFSPFELMFRREGRLLVDEVLETYPIETECPNLQSYVEALKAKMEFVHSVAKEALDEAHQHNKHCYDQFVHPISLEPDNKVFVKNVGVRRMHKLALTFLPEVYKVIWEVYGNRQVYEVKNLTKLVLCDLKISPLADLVCLGDMNKDYGTVNPGKRKLSKYLKSFNLENLISVPNRITLHSAKYIDHTPKILTWHSTCAKSRL